MEIPKTEHAEITEYGKALRFILDSESVETVDAGLKECLDVLKKAPAGEYLQTFVDSYHRSEIDFFLRRGFYINNVLLFMELDLNEFERTHGMQKESLRADCLPGLSCRGKIGVSIYDTSAGLDEYVRANGLGFGEPDPRAQIEEQLANEDAVIYVARHRNRIVSSVSSWKIDEGIYATENIFTIPKFRDKKIAGTLLKKVLFTIKEGGADKARLTVFANDYIALSLYYGLGFKLCSEKYELRY